jgi:integrase
MVHVWLRGEKFVARGSYQGERFGVTLGKDKQQAEAGLRRLLTEIEDGKFSRASERPPRFFPIAPIGRLTLRELCDRCLQERRKLRGLATANTYKARLSHVLDHADGPDVARRWPLAQSIDRGYAIDLRTFLTRRQVARNGRSGGKKRSMSARQIRNALESLKMVLDWGVRADVRLLPVDFVNPITSEILGPPPIKDPLRKVALALPARIAMLERMDDWQLQNLTSLLVLPLRPEDVARAIVSDVDFSKGELRLGDHFDGCDFSKGKVNVLMPLPPALIDLFRLCVGQRAEGPLFLSRGGKRPKRSRLRALTNQAALRGLYDHELSKRGAQEIQAPADQKRVYCELLRKLGGVTTDELSKEIRKLLPKDCSARPYDLRHGVTQDMHDSGIQHLAMRYMTAHTTRDIMNEYIALDPRAEMRKYYARCEPLLKLIEERVRRLASTRSAA